MIKSTRHLAAWGIDRSTWVLLAAIAAFTFVSLPDCAAQAQPLPVPDVALPSVTAPCAPEVTANRNAQLLNGTTPGIWFDLRVARCMADRLEALPLYAERVHILEERLVLTGRLEALLREEVSLASHEAELARTALESAVRLQREAEEELHAFTRSPVLWFSIGAGAVILALVVFAYAT